MDKIVRSSDPKLLFMRVDKYNQHTVCVYVHG